MLFSTCSSSCSTTNMACSCISTVVFFFLHVWVIEVSLKPLEKAGTLTCLNATVGKPYARSTIWPSVEAWRRRWMWPLNSISKVGWIHITYCRKMQFLSEWARYLKNSNPIFDSPSYGKRNKFHVLVVSRPWQGALFCCYAVLKQNSLRPGSASADPL